MINKRATLAACLMLGTLGLCPRPAGAQIANVVDDGGRHFFINDNPKLAPKLTAPKRTNIYLPAETSLTGRSRPGMTVDRDGVDKLVREAADRHRMDPALVRAVITKPTAHGNAAQPQGNVARGSTPAAAPPTGSVASLRTRTTAGPGSGPSPASDASRSHR